MNITNMLKKDHEIKWTTDARRYFKEIKQAITEAPVLVSPDFSRYFLIFSYAFNHAIAGVLLQKMVRMLNNPYPFLEKC